MPFLILLVVTFSLSLVLGLFAGAGMLAEPENFQTNIYLMLAAIFFGVAACFVALSVTAISVEKQIEGLKNEWK